MANLNPLVIFGYFLCFTVIGLLSWQLVECKKKEEFCLCQGIGNKVCPDPTKLQHLYNSGKLTEYTDLSKYPASWTEGNQNTQFHDYKD